METTQTSKYFRNQSMLSSLGYYSYLKANLSRVLMTRKFLGEENAECKIITISKR